MRRFRFPVSLAVLSAACLSGGQAAPALPSFAGVTWQTPAGMKLNTSWGYDCPSRCVAYEGGGSGAGDDFPLIRVHEPLIGTAQTAVKTLTAWMQRERGEVVTVLNNGSETVGQTGVTLTLLQRADDAEDRRPDYSLFVLVERGGVTLPLELYALNDEDVSGPRLAVLGALADTVKLAPAAARKDIAFRTQRFANLQRAVADGYAKGGRARVFLSTQVRFTPVVNFDLGMTMRSEIDARTAAFLPGGVFLDAGPEPDYRTPNLRRMSRGEFPATWKAVSGGFQVMRPDGQTTLYTLGNQAGQPTLKEGGTTYSEAAPLKAADLVGIFSSTSTSSSSLMGTAVFSRSDSDLELLSGGRYLSGNASFTSVSSANVAGGTGGKRAEGGTWAYDPASYTLTLKPEGGGAISGPTYTVAYSAQTREGPIEAGKSVDWTVLGRFDWWKRK